MLYIRYLISTVLLISCACARILRARRCVWDFGWGCSNRFAFTARRGVWTASGLERSIPSIFGGTSRFRGCLAESESDVFVRSPARLCDDAPNWFGIDRYQYNLPVLQSISSRTGARRSLSLRASRSSEAGGAAIITRRTLEAESRTLK